MTELERIARAIDPEAWSWGNRGAVDLMLSRRNIALAAAARVQELLREELANAWDEGRRRGDRHGFAEALLRRGESVELPDMANPYAAALGVAEQPGIKSDAIGTSTRNAANVTHEGRVS